MIKILCYTDLQATDGNERCFNDPAMPLQRYRVDLFYKKLLEVYKKLGCSALWDLGDTTDDRSAIPLPTLGSVRVGLQPFGKSPFNIKLTGNHEQYTRNTEIDNRYLFNDMFNVVDGVQAFEIEDIVVIACSYPATQAQAAQAVESMILRHRRKPIVILGHLEISGTKMKSGTSLTGLPTELFDPAVVTLLGHIHIPQQLGLNIHYVGSPFQQDFGEAGEAKRLALVTIDGNAITLEWIALEGFPQYRYVTWPEFERMFDPASEDRYTVRIASPDEATAFYKHPYSARAYIEYDYSLMNTDLAGGEPIKKDWSLQATIERWVQVHDPADCNIAINPAELVQFGTQIAEEDLVK